MVISGRLIVHASYRGCSMIRWRACAAWSMMRCRTYTWSWYDRSTRACVQFIHNIRRMTTVLWKPCMSDIYLSFICAHYGLYPNAPVTTRITIVNHRFGSFISRRVALVPCCSNSTVLSLLLSVFINHARLILTYILMRAWPVISARTRML